MVDIVFLGDIVGRSGREVVLAMLPEIQERLKPHVIIANVENAAGGFGATPEICKELFESGIHVLTSGNHIWDQESIRGYISKEQRLLRPLNFPQHLPGRGVYAHELLNGQSVIVINLMGNVFMDPLNLAFPSVQEVLKSYPLNASTIAGIVVDFHAECTAEKMALAHYLDGKVSVVLGTHTHIPTADAQIFSHGTGFQADAGMCGDYNSVLGMQPQEPIQRFAQRIRHKRYETTKGDGTLCGVFVRINEMGLCSYISPLIQGPRLRCVWPAPD